MELIGTREERTVAHRRCRSGSRGGVGVLCWPEKLDDEGSSAFVGVGAKEGLEVGDRAWHVRH
jgi:hypothetical protein